MFSRCINVQIHYMYVSIIMRQKMDPLYTARSTIWLILIMTFSIVHMSFGFIGFSKIMHYKKNKKFDRISFLAVGDWGRDGAFNQSQVATQMGEIGKKLGIEFVISTGDNFYDTGLKGLDDPQFQSSFSNIYTAQSLQKPWYAVLGNHDYMGVTAAQLSPKLKRRDKRWHCERNFILKVAALVDIVFIDTTPFVDENFVNPKKRKFDWSGVLPRDKYLSGVRKNLDSLLKKSKAPWKIVVGHYTIRSIGHHADTKEMVDQILPILEANKMPMYINGHDHCLQHLSNRKGTLHFLTSGGGSKAWKNDIHRGAQNGTVHFYHDGQGFLAVQLKKGKAWLAFYNVMGKVLHNIELKK